MAAVNINKEELDQLIGAVTKYSDDLKTQFINPCVEALRTCGLDGDFMKEIDPLADDLFATLNDVMKQLAEETGSPDGSVLDALKSFTKGVEEQLANPAFKGVGAKLEDTKGKKVEISRKKRN